MARVYVNAPSNTVVSFEGREYAPRTTLPARATEYGVTAWVDATDEEIESGAPDRFPVYLPAVPVGTTKSEIQDMIDDARGEMADAGDYGYSEGSGEVADWEDMWD